MEVCTKLLAHGTQSSVARLVTSSAMGFTRRKASTHMWLFLHVTAHSPVPSVLGWPAAIQRRVCVGAA